MATYKVIQDIEAEDKLLGPLTLRQFIYAVIVVVMGFIAFRLSLVAWYTALPFLPPMILFAVLAAPFGHDQPSEVWLLAKIRFSLKPRKRIWDQSGINQLVTITAPKRVEKHYTDGLSQTEVHSRLRALADTIDSRGWAVKNVNVNLSSQPGFDSAFNSSDRLVAPSTLPQEVPSIDVLASDDIMDARNNPVAAQLDQMMTASATAHREQALRSMDDSRNQQTSNTQATPANDYWFMNQPDPAQLPAPGYAAFGTQIVTPGSSLPDPVVSQASSQASSDELALLDQLHEEQSHLPQVTNGHMKVINPLGQQPTSVSPTTPQIPAPGVLELASNDDLNVATIAREADRAQKKKPIEEQPSIAPQPPAFASIATPTTTPPPPVTRAPEPVILELASNDDLNVATIAREADRAQKKKPPADEVVISLR